MIDVEQLRVQSLWFARLTLALLVATALVILIPTLISMAVLARSDGDWQRLGAVSLLMWSPSVFYLAALWSVRRAFADFAAGGQFGAVMSAGCSFAGAALALGAAMSALGVPNLGWMLGLDGRNFRPFQSVGTVFHFDPAYLAVGAVGLALILLGRLLTRAAELQVEVATLRGELEEIF